MKLIIAYPLRMWGFHKTIGSPHTLAYNILGSISGAPYSWKLPRMEIAQGAPVVTSRLECIPKASCLNPNDYCIADISITILFPILLLLLLLFAVVA